MTKTKSARSRGKGMTKTDLLLKVEALEAENVELKITILSYLDNLNKISLVVSGRNTIFNSLKRVKAIVNILLR
jgi:hypothetical protein